MNIQDIISVCMTKPTLFTEEEIKSHIETLIKLEIEYLSVMIEKEKSQIKLPQTMTPSSVKLMKEKLAR